MNPELIARSRVLRLLLSFILTVVALSTALMCHEGDEEATRHEIEREKAALAHIEEEWLNALNKADVNAIAEVLADDFLRPIPDSGQFVNKTDLLRFYRSHLSPQGSDQRRIDNMTVTLYGTTALARGL